MSIRYGSILPIKQHNSFIELQYLFNQYAYYEINTVDKVNNSLYLFYKC